MGKEHRAFVFDYDAFSAELRPVLDAALGDGQTQPLREFIESNRTALKDPYAGEPLEAGWENLLETEDVQEYGDFALTRYYDPADDIGVGTEWPAVQDALVRAADQGIDLTLGHTVGPPGRAFDPGGMGSYFLTNAEAAARLEALREIIRRDPALRDRLGALLAMFETVANSGKGMYVTF